MLIQASEFSLSLVHPPESGLPFSATEPPHQLPACWSRLSPCAGCCWAGGTGSPHQSAETPWHWHTNPESIHARPYCQALWALIPSTTASRKPVPHHRNSRWCSVKAWHLRHPQSSHKLKGCWSIQLHSATKPVQWETKTPLVLPFTWWETRTKHYWKRGGHSGTDRRREKKAAPKSSTHPSGSETPGTVAKKSQRNLKKAPAVWKLM